MARDNRIIFHLLICISLYNITEETEGKQNNMRSNNNNMYIYQRKYLITLTIF